MRRRRLINPKRILAVNLNDLKSDAFEASIWSAPATPPQRGCRAGDPGCRRFGRSRLDATAIRLKLHATHSNFATIAAPSRLALPDEVGIRRVGVSGINDGEIGAVGVVAAAGDVSRTDTGATSIWGFGVSVFSTVGAG